MQYIPSLPLLMYFNISLYCQPKLIYIFIIFASVNELILTCFISTQLYIELLRYGMYIFMNLLSTVNYTIVKRLSVLRELS